MRRIEVKPKEGFADPSAASLKREIEEMFQVELNGLMITKAYTIEGELDAQQVEMLGKELFADKVSEQFSTSEPLYKNTWRIEVGFLPGMTDNVGNTSKTAIRDMLGKECEVYTSRVYYLDARFDDPTLLDRIADRLLANKVIERWKILDAMDKSFDPFPAKVEIGHEPTVQKINLDIEDRHLERMSKDRLLALSLEEMQTISAYYKKKMVLARRKKLGLDGRATDVELEALAQSWSEHCKHKIFNAKIKYHDGDEVETVKSLFKTYIAGATERARKPYIVSVFKDNGGIIKFNPEYDIAVKVETHNAPSALDPYGGALTGILGVNRDILGTGLGAKPIANVNMLCFGLLNETDVPKGAMHPKRIAKGVIRGIEAGGNPVGIPTVNGSITFEKCYTARPLVYAGTIGIMPNKIGDRLTSEKKITPGALAVMIGGRIGKDGIHGATFSSQQLTTGIAASVVQIGDAITQKKEIDMVIEARDRNLFEAVTDNGAGGLSSSIGELGRLSDGCEIWLDKCPLKYPGLDPWEILLSESQERMTLAVAEKDWEELQKVAKKHDVEATIVGKFTDSGYFHLKYGTETVGYLDMKFLHEGNEDLELKAVWERKLVREPSIKEEDPNDVLLKLLAAPNIASKEWVVRQYDHEVQGGSVVKPLTCSSGPTDAAVIRPLLDWKEGLVVAHGICPRYAEDSYHMAQLAVDEGVRNALCSGAMFSYLACLDNFSWPDPVKSEKTPDGEYKLAQLVRCVKGFHDAVVAYGVPVISGKDSMKNDYYASGEKHSILPTLLVTVVGKIADVERAVTMDFKEVGDTVYLLGKTSGALGGSEYNKLYGGVGNGMPTVDLKANGALYAAFSKATATGCVRSAHDVSDGGIAVAFAESAFAGGKGADLDLALCEKETTNEIALLFGEDAGRIIVSVKPEDEKKFEMLMSGTSIRKVGRVRGDKRVVIRNSQKILINKEFAELREVWKGGLKW